jgi:hypothetical protein
MKPATTSWLCLIIFVLYCADLAWKAPHFAGFARTLPLWSFVLALSIRVAYMGGLLWGFLLFRKKAKQQKQP